MCGLFGFWLPKPLSVNDLQDARKATYKLKHRGPDDDGEWFDQSKGIYMGHCRLSVMDETSASAQPMSINGYTMVFNGTIYNFEELREDLRALGVEFFSDGDTEVLLRAWIEWGENCIEKLDGMFAFAVFDGHSLALVTDPFGEKPLYVYNIDGGIYFSSEPANIISYLSLPFQPTTADSLQFLALGFFPKGETGYNNLKCLQPSSLLWFEPNKCPKVKKYWDRQNFAEINSKKVFSGFDLDEFLELLTLSLRRRVRTKVPLGLFLSSGTDSSLIACLLKKELKKDFDAVTLVFPGFSDESVHAASVCEVLSLKHRIISQNQTNFSQSQLSQLTDLYGVPNDNSTGLSIKKLADDSRKYFKVALGGVGADELFAGYNRYQFYHKHSKIIGTPQWLSKMLKSLRLANFNSKKIKRLGHLLDSNYAVKYMAIKFPEFFEDLTEDDIKEFNLPHLSVSDWPFLESMVRFDQEEMLFGSYLPSIDRGSMAAGLEVRSPFLTKELFQFMSQFDMYALIRDGQKAPLKTLLRRYLPDRLVNSSKKGFIAPVTTFSETANSSGKTDRNLTGVSAKTFRVATSYNEAVFANRVNILKSFSSKSKQ